MQRNILILTEKDSLSKKLHQIIEDLNRISVIFTVNNIDRAYMISMQRQIHLFIIDIKLGDVSGFGFIQEIRSVKKYEFMPVIFLTSMEDSKLYSYNQLGCFCYIEKPFDSRRLARYIVKALEFPVITDRDRYIYFRKEGVLYLKCISDIVYFEISRTGVIVQCENDKLQIPYKPSSQILDELDSPSFIQCSRQAIINREYIEQIDYTRRYVKLKNISKLIEIGPVMKNKFKAAIEQ